MDGKEMERRLLIADVTAVMYEELFKIVRTKGFEFMERGKSLDDVHIAIFAMCDAFNDVMGSLIGNALAVDGADREFAESFSKMYYERMRKRFMDYYLKKDDKEEKDETDRPGKKCDIDTVMAALKRELNF